MISDYRCFICLVKSFERILDREPLPPEMKNKFTLEMISLYRDNHDKLDTPVLARDLHVLLKEYTGNPDPYKEEKTTNNIQALEMVPELKNIIYNSDDIFLTSMRIALAGNIIDFAASQNFDIERNIQKALVSPFAIDHSEQLRAAVSDAESILYLGDNAGEIVFDKLFIEATGKKNIIYAVRGMPVINDVTIEDADFAGMPDVATVISNGYDAPSTIIEKSGREFRDHFDKASVIISKGQGNLEGLLYLNDPRIFFLLMVKCEVMAGFLKVDKGSFVVFNPATGNGQKPVK
jgi:uncharacterized protein with ATP-grasp and redox domains